MCYCTKQVMLHKKIEKSRKILTVPLEKSIIKLQKHIKVTKAHKNESEVLT